jgi:hypothetical protein
MAELSIFYCEEAFGFLESRSMEDESYFAALIRMYERSLEFVLSLPPAERAPTTSSVSISLDRAGGTSAGGFMTNSIAFGMLPLWTSTSEWRLAPPVRQIDEGEPAEPGCPLLMPILGRTRRSGHEAYAAIA